MSTFKKAIDAGVISLAEIGWTEARNDVQIAKYITSFIKKNYGKKIDGELAVVIALIIGDLLWKLYKANRNKTRARG